MKCLGRNLNSHCCNLGAAGVCRHLEENTEPGFRWTCGLRRKLGSWSAVLNSKEYKADVKPHLDKMCERAGVPAGTINCRDYPAPFGCHNCGAK